MGTLSSSAPKKDTLRIYWRLLRYLRAHRAILSVAIVCMILFGASDSAIPFILKHVLDDIFGNHNTEMLWILVGAIVGLSFFRAGLGFFQRYLSVVVGLRIVEDLRNEIAAHLLTLSPAFYSNKSTGSLISSMTNDTLLIRRAITDALVTMLKDSIRVICLVITAIILDPFLGMIAFVAFPLALIPVMKFGRKVRKLSRSGQDSLGGLTSILHENIIGHKVVQAFCLEKHEQQRFTTENQKSTRSLTKAAKYGALSAPINEVLASGAIALVLVYGGLSVIAGERTQGDFIAFITAMLLMYEPLKNSGKVSATVQAGVAAAERVFEILDTKSEIIELKNAVTLPSDFAEVRFENVGFQYPSKSETDAEAALAGVSFSVSAGETLALVGPSGAGKSTLVSLLPRFYDPLEGKILIHGRDIREYTLESLRQQIAVVDQHTFLFDTDFYNNIAFGKPSASRDEVIAAAKAANAHSFIADLPEGYESRIGEQGLRLSGGQRARIAIARALLKDAPILILDEATASLDSESELAVQSAIDRLMRGRTVFVIAHRLSTIRSANKIAVLRQGRLVELGTHLELLEAKGEYSKLYQLQFAGEADGLRLSAQIAS